MNKHPLATLAVAAALPGLAGAQAAAPLPVAELDRVTIIGSRPATLPLEIPTTTESIDAAQIARSINATDSEDALKYFPSLNVRKRYIGDHDHAVLASRASGTGNSARSLVYADGILLSNLLGNGASFTPRWGLVTPEEIDRVDVLYGPFSAAYPGNSVGAVVDYVTRMPKAFEAHVKLQDYSQRYKQYNTNDRFGGHSGSVALGSREGGLSWWFNLSRLDSEGQPITFANRLMSAAVTPPPGATVIPVTGAVADRNPANNPWWIFGDTGRSHTVQDHAKLKLAYDLSPSLRATYTVGLWRNETHRTVNSYLRDASGNTVRPTATEPAYVEIDGRVYAVNPSDFASSHAELEHLAQGLTLKSQTRGEWDWEAAVSDYAYRRDEVRNSVTGVTDMKGTGWNTLALKGIWRPVDTMHTVEAGLQRDAFKLRTQATAGASSLQSLWMQDAWHISPDWRAVLGARLEQWHVESGNAAQPVRREAWFSPKLAISHALDDVWMLKASLGRAVRAPTVVELYQLASAGTRGDPNLRPETSWTGELTAERSMGAGLLRTTFFAERTEDALYSQTNVTVTPTVTSVQNVDTIRTRGLEAALQWPHALLRGLDLNASLTFADSIIVKNDKFPASVGRWQPRVPRWRATMLASYKVDAHWNTSLGVRYSGKQYGTLDNGDPNGRTYTGVSSFLVADLRVVYRFDKQWSAAFGIDNLNNERYWAFHPYTQRTFNAELRFDL
jgi:iron complex outermembrane receptor protein